MGSAVIPIVTLCLWESLAFVTAVMVGQDLADTMDWFHLCAEAWYELAPGRMSDMAVRTAAEIFARSVAMSACEHGNYQQLALGLMADMTVDTRIPSLAALR